MHTELSGEFSKHTALFLANIPKSILTSIYYSRDTF